MRRSFGTWVYAVAVGAIAVAALVVTCVALVGISSGTKQGFSAWLKWKEKI